MKNKQPILVCILFLVFAIQAFYSTADAKCKGGEGKEFNAQGCKIKDTVTIGDNIFLFAERGSGIEQYLEIWMVKTNKNHTDTTSIYSTTLHYYDGFETDYDAVSAEYDVIGDQFVLYSHLINTHYSLEEGTVTKSSTTKETFVIQKRGKVVRLDCRYGMLNEKVLDKELDDQITSRTDHYFPFGGD